ncbi:MAG: hypothetical protein FWD53_08890, partial [Phycisphaerales bacterium]|nr:hypothetical protein [Phycisphaerales bacterium]
MLSKTCRTKPARKTARKYQHFMETLEIRTLLSSNLLWPSALGPCNNAQAASIAAPFNLTVPDQIGKPF